MRPEGRLTLVGAGPGDAELITLKALRALGEAEVLLYDALVNPELLAYAPRAEKIYVGKRKGCMAYAQQQINELIVQRGRGGRNVVRLKGGDPFVFGRGAEEMRYAAAHGMEVAVIPGLSSGLAVPAAQGIPVTLRGVAESFWVITGTTRDHRMSADVALAARSSATVIILMGMSKLPVIMACFMEAGKADTPVAIIQDGTTPRERMAVGTVGTIAEEATRLGLSNPAIIVVGEAVRERERFHAIQTNVARAREGAFIP